jgi:hypothetical protein
VREETKADRGTQSSKREAAEPRIQIVMLWKTFLTLSASAMLGTVLIAPNGALAFGPPPIGGPPPALGGLPHLGVPPSGIGGLPHLGGPAPHLGGPRLGGPAGHSLGATRQGLSGVHNYGRSGGYSYGRSGYGYGGWRHRYGRYGVYVAGSSSSYSNDGCYYTYSLGRRIQVCDEN